MILSTDVERFVRTHIRDFFYVFNMAPIYIVIMYKPPLLPHLVPPETSVHLPGGAEPLSREEWTGVHVTVSLGHSGGSASHTGTDVYSPGTWRPGGRLREHDCNSSWPGGEVTKRK